MAAQIQVQSANGIIAVNEQQQPLILVGTAAPSNSQIGIAPGCLYIRTGATPELYNNTGTAASTTWTAIT